MKALGIILMTLIIGLSIWWIVEEPVNFTTQTTQIQLQANYQTDDIALVAKEVFGKRTTKWPATVDWKSKSYKVKQIKNKAVVCIQTDCARISVNGQVEIDKSSKSRERFGYE